jgi:alpha-L-arabinofuranosidase
MKAFALLIGFSAVLFGQSTLTIEAGRPGPRISPSLYGIFFEEINHAGDGGLFAELVQSGSFEGGSTKGWSLQGEGKMQVDSERPLNQAHQRSLKVEIAKSPVTLINDGYWGMAVQQGAGYRLSFYARAASGFAGELEAKVISADGKIHASAKFGGLISEWKRLERVVTSNATDPSARLEISINAPGTLWLDLISLFPQNTWKGRRNGLRPDLAAKLAAMKPAFVRFPGGCYVEGGNYCKDAFRWKTTIGDMADRPGHSNSTWNYWSTDGLGYHEYLQMCEDLGAEAMFVVNVGMAHRDVIPMDKLQEWVDEALDAIEYANGPVTSKWGLVRAKNGHPNPFNLKYLEIGNENGGPNYEERYAVFYKAIKSRYPGIVTIANSNVKSPIDIIDHHIYTTAELMRAAAHRYDTYDRKLPKVFVGEYACNREVGKGNLKGALAEAAYMFGFERNSDAVVLSAYAPLFYHVNDRRWPVNLIGFDNARSFGMPSYWVQVLLAQNRGDVVLPVKVETDREKIGTPIERGAIGLGTWNTQAEFKDVKVTNSGTVLFAADFQDGAKAWRTTRGKWEAKDGVYRQSALETDVRAIAGDPNWTDYTLTLKARKLGGSEGFLIMFRVKDNRDWYWLNIGGWGNGETAVERSYRGGKSRLPESGPGGIETGRWYDIKIVVEGAKMRYSLDGKEVFTSSIYPDVDLPLMEAIATKIDSTGEVLLKVVNFAKEPRKTAVRLTGIAKLSGTGTSTVLTSASAEDENSLDEPMKVAPKSSQVSGLGTSFEYTFAPNSLTILRLKH